MLIGHNTQLDFDWIRVPLRGLHGRSPLCDRVIDMTKTKAKIEIIIITIHSNCDCQIQRFREGKSGKVIGQEIGFVFLPWAQSMGGERSYRKQ